MPLPIMVMMMMMMMIAEIERSPRTTAHQNMVRIIQTLSNPWRTHLFGAVPRGRSALLALQIRNAERKSSKMQKWAKTGVRNTEMEIARKSLLYLISIICVQNGGSNLIVVYQLSKVSLQLWTCSLDSFLRSKVNSRWFTTRYLPRFPWICKPFDQEDFLLAKIVQL